MKQQKKLTSALRDYYDNQETSLNESDWEQASAYLNAARRKRRIRNYGLVLTTLLSILFIATYNFKKFSAINEFQTSSISTKKLKLTSLLKPKVAPTPMVLESKTKISAKLNSPKKSGNLYYTGASKTESHRNVPNEKTNLSYNMTPQVFESTNLAEAKFDTHDQGNNSNKENAINSNSELKPSSLATIKSKDDTKKDNVINEVELNPKKDTKLISLATENINDPQNNLPANEIPQMSINTPAQTTTARALNDNKKEIEKIDEPKYNNLTEKAFTSFVDTLHHTSVLSETTAMEIEVVDTLSEPDYVRCLAAEGIFYEAGAAWNFGWKGPLNRDARGFSPVAGVNYMNRLGNRYSLSFGLQYLQVNNLSGSSKTSRVSSYLYGEQSRVTVITPSKLHYLVAPIRLHFYLNDRNVFGGGINMAYLLNVEAKVTSYDEKPGFTGNYETVKLSGYNEGFSWFDSQLALFYRRKMSHSLELQAEVFVGLMDVKQNEFFQFTHKERNSGAKLSLIYNVFRKNRR